MTIVHSTLPDAQHINNRCKLSLRSVVAAGFSKPRGEGGCAVHTCKVWPDPARFVYRATLSGLQEGGVEIGLNVDLLPGIGRQVDHGHLQSSAGAAPSWIGGACLTEFAAALLVFYAGSLRRINPPPSLAASRPGSQGKRGNGCASLAPMLQHWQPLPPPPPQRTRSEAGGTNYGLRHGCCRRPVLFAALHTLYVVLYADWT